MSVIKFDRSAPGEGVNAQCHLENGKVILDWQIALWNDVTVDAGKSGETKCILHIRLKDLQGNVVAECIQEPEEEEPLTSIVLQPHLWTTRDNPDLYRLEATLADAQGNCLDRLARQLPVRCVELRRMPGEDVEKLFLNGECFVPKAVKYEWESEERFQADLALIAGLGANCICLQGTEKIPCFVKEICDRNGLLVVAHVPGKLAVGEMLLCVEKDRTPEDYMGKIPVFCGEEEALYVRGNEGEDKCGDVIPTTCYYQYRARWSKVPFVYIRPESLKRMKSGNYTVTCYSNCKRLALYTDGKLFEFQHGQEIFTFQEVPAKGPCIMLAVEGEGCSASLSVHKTFTKLSLIGDN